MNDTNKLAQYKECVQSFHHLERASWQLPSLAIILLSIICTIAWQVLVPGFPRAILLYCGSAIMIAFAYAAKRFSCCMSVDKGIISRISALEVDLGLGFIYGDKEYLYGKEPHYKRGATYYLCVALFVIAAAVFVLAILATIEAFYPKFGGLFQKQ